MRFKNDEERWLYHTRKERKILEDFVREEKLMAMTVFDIYRQKHVEMPDDVYRGIAFFINEEWLKKPGSLCLLYETKQHILADMPAVEKETALDQTCYFFKVYCAALTKGGF
jgi:hypothetical protein